MDDLTVPCWTVKEPLSGLLCLFINQPKPNSWPYSLGQISNKCVFKDLQSFQCYSKLRVTSLGSDGRCLALPTKPNHFLWLSLWDSINKWAILSCSIRYPETWFTNPLRILDAKTEKLLHLPYHCFAVNSYIFSALLPMGFYGKQRLRIY